VGLPQAHRLKNRKDFQSVYQQGVRYSSPHLILRALPPSGGSVSLNNNVRESSPSLVSATRFGISISQKVSKKAVIRNRIKRQIRSAIRELLPHLSPGWKVVIVVRPSAVECKYEHFLRELKQLLVKAKIVNGHSREYIL
jgi:ribonuclease P protein component